MKLCRHCKKNEGTILDRRPYVSCSPCNSARARAYRTTKAGKETYRAIMKRQYLKHRIKVLARAKLGRAVKSGKIIKPIHCQKCGLSSRLDGHHEDYAQALSVVWLCRPCHSVV